jgi:tetrapyrrole methylase family protein/MazG family protein
LNDKNDEHIKEELGDIFLVLTMIAVIFEEDNKFTTHDILDEVTQKIIRRHPHVFNNTTLNNSDEVVRQWENIKKDVEKKSVPGFLLASVPKGISPYERAFLLQKKAAKNGFDWKKPSCVRQSARRDPRT